MIELLEYRNVRARQLTASFELSARHRDNSTLLPNRSFTQTSSPAPPLRLFLTTPPILHHQQGLDIYLAKWRRQRTKNPKANPATTARCKLITSAYRCILWRSGSTFPSECNNFAIHLEHPNTSDLNFICLFGCSRRATQTLKTRIILAFCHYVKLLFPGTRDSVLTS
jgi:hypothetical protein